MALIRNSTKVFNAVVIFLLLSKSTVMAQKLPFVKAETIIKSIQKDKPVNLKNVTIEGDLDFTKLVAYPESNSQNRVRILSSVYFENCTFKGKIIGHAETVKGAVYTSFEANLGFNDCTFYQDILLNSVVVGTSLVMEKAKTHGELHLENVTVGQDANFSESVFGRKVFFQNSIFRKNAYFNKSIFNETGNFQSCKWEGEAIFREAEFRENMDFSMQRAFSLMSFNFSRFKNVGFFDGSRFGDNLEIDNVSAERIMLSNCQFHQKVNFENINARETHFTDSIFFVFIPDFAKIVSYNGLVEQSGVRCLSTFKLDKL